MQAMIAQARPSNAVSMFQVLHLEESVEDGLCDFFVLFLHFILFNFLSRWSGPSKGG